MAGRTAIDDVPLRRSFEDDDLESRVIGWSQWLHLDETSTKAERRDAKLAQMEFERREDKSTMFYAIKQVLIVLSLE